MKKIRIISIALLILFSVISAPAADVLVSAAASLSDALKAVAAAYEKSSGDKIVFNFGASSFLARQIAEGAPSDVFFPADQAKMDELEAKGLIVKETRRTRLLNSLVIVVSSKHDPGIKEAEDLTGKRVKRIALAEPQTVPAGIYAKEYLQRMKLWSWVQPKVVPTENVRASLAAVEGGNADAAIVYKTDAAISSKVKVAYEVPAEHTPKISYPMAVMKEAKQPEAAKKFLDYLAGDEAGKVFEKFGFILSN